MGCNERGLKMRKQWLVVKGGWSKTNIQTTAHKKLKVWLVLLLGLRSAHRHSFYVSLQRSRDVAFNANRRERWTRPQMAAWSTSFLGGLDDGNDRRRITAGTRYIGPVLV